MLSALKLPGVRWIVTLLGAEYLVEFASSIALMVVVYDATDSALAAAAMLVAKQVAPGVLLAARSGLLDGRDSRGALATAYAFRAAAFVLLMVASYGAAFLALAFLAGLSGATARVVLRARMASSCRGEIFRSANAVANLVFGAMTLIGPAVGALVVAAAGSDGSMAVWASSALLLGGMAVIAPFGQPAPDVATEPTVDDAVRPARGPRVSLTALLALASLLLLAFAMDEPALLAYVERDLGGGVGEYGLLLTMWGVGVLLGGALYTRFGTARLLRAFGVGVACTSAGYIGLGLAPTLAVACAAAVVGGIGNGTWWVALTTLVLERADHGDKARYTGRLEGMTMALPALGMLLGGLLATVASPRLTLLLPGFITFAALLAWSMLAVPRSRAPRSTAVATVAPMELA